jgi:hypothetical protein
MDEVEDSLYLTPNSGTIVNSLCRLFFKELQSDGRIITLLLQIPDSLFEPSQPCLVFMINDTPFKLNVNKFRHQFLPSLQDRK